MLGLAWPCIKQWLRWHGFYQPLLYFIAYEGKISSKMERKDFFTGWKRDETLDQPGIVINPEWGTTIPQVVGFRRADGHPVQISLSKAEEWGLVEKETIRPVTVPVKDFLELK